MFPYIEIFGRDIGLYAIMTLCGVFTAGIYSCVLANRRKHDYADMIIFILLSFVGVVIGSHLLYALVNFKNVILVFNNVDKIETPEKFFNALNLTIGGSVFYGGLIGLITVCYALTKKDKNKIVFLDIVAVNIPLFHFFGRIGCFLGGCCYGIPAKIGFTYTNNPIAEANGVRRFPVQLLEASFNLILFLLLNHLLDKGKFRNKLMYMYLTVYATGRFFIEFLRGDTYRGMWLFLSTSQIISILIVFIVIVILIRQNKLYGIL